MDPKLLIMKYFLGVVLAVIVVALVFRLTKKADTNIDLTAIKESVTVATQPGDAAKHNVEVIEVIQASSYTYMKVKEGSKEYWIATVKEDMAVGSKYSFGDALQMDNFTSKELNRTFPVIYFISENGESSEIEQNIMAAPVTMGKPKVEPLTDVVISQNAGGVSISELYRNRNSYSDKKVKVKGKVVKVNMEVMDRNWVHIQDGTSDSGNFDLTVTTLESAKVGDILEFEGTIAINKDFGAGYVYDLIMEGGVIRSPI